MTPAADRSYQSTRPMSDGRRRERERQVQRQLMERQLWRIPITIPERDYLLEEDTDEWTE